MIKNKIKYWVIIFCISISISCKRNSEISTSATTITIDSNSQIQDKVFFSELIDSIRYVKLETNDSMILIGEINKIILAKNKLFVLDRNNSKSLYIFDLDGILLNRINNIGDGPGEFREPTDFELDTLNNQILLYCKKTKSINFYDFNGSFVKSWHTDLVFKGFTISPNNHIACFVHDVFNYNDKHGALPYNLLTLDFNNELIHTQFPNEMRSGKSKVVFTFNNYFFRNSMNTYLHWTFSDTIYKFRNHTVIPEFFIDFPKKRIQYSKNEDSRLVFQKIKNGDYWSVFGDIAISDNYLLFQYIGKASNFSNPQPFFCFYNISLKRSSFIREVENDIDDGYFNMPIASYKDFFVSVNYSEELYNRSKDNIKLTGIDESIKQYDNPILVFTKVKLNKYEN